MPAVLAAQVTIWLQNAANRAGRQPSADAGTRGGAARPQQRSAASKETALTPGGVLP
jgi:hypothetical protein